MGIRSQAVAPAGQLLDAEKIQNTLAEGLNGRFAGQHVVVLIPDHTRTIPLPQLFKIVVDLLSDTAQLDFLVALGTHPPLSDDALCRLVGITTEEHATTYRHVRLLNHEWDQPDMLATIGEITDAEIEELAGDVYHPSLAGAVDIRVNQRVLDCDHVVILGPTFPHEVVGFSGGAKYFFPGISGPEMINKTHWLGALMTILDTIGVKETPVRAMIHHAAAHIPTETTLAALTVVGEGLAGMFVGDYLSAWRAAANLSSQRHIQWVDTPYQRVLSQAPPMYDELWTAAKAMYKVEPAIADGGEVIVYAPHLDTVSHVHGKHIYEAGYHIRDFYLKQWDRYGNLPLGVLAHGTHLRGTGTYENGIERPRIHVTLASRIPRADCERLNLGYLDPDAIDPEAWKNREDEGVLYIPKAGETLYRVRST